LLIPFPSRYGPVMNVVPWLIESDDEFPSARIKSENREKEEMGNVSQNRDFNGCKLDENFNVRLNCSFRVLNTE
jgi:hypothetical protein